VKFFKLVESATFLNACILHRYFNQIRHVALKIILRAYSAAKGPVSVRFGINIRYKAQDCADNLVNSRILFK